MGTEVLFVIEIILLVVGIAGCIVPGLPGMPLAYGAILIQHFDKNQHNYPGWLLVGLGIIVLLIIVMQYVIPAWTTKKFGASKYAVWGSIVGLVLGLFSSFLGPFGVVIGPFVGAVLGELLFAKKTLSDSMWAGLGAFLGILASSVVELVFTLGIVVVFILSLV